ncbi:MAG: nucleoside/nucleotide kinase family protein [Clostridia bacterium]|nr:nucleoside/nucleotide kinase family protein [Clostridia bacterium]
MRRTFMINGLPVDAVFAPQTVEEVLRPLLVRWQEMQRKKGGRLIVFLAAPPGTGKSTLAAFMQELAREKGIEGFQAVGMDGFHHLQKYIASHTVIRDGREIPMQRVKGAPDSFDVYKLKNALEEMRRENVSWPGYDRTLHDVVENQTLVTGSIVLVEGNYFRLDRDVWRDMPHDFSVFIEAEEEQLRKRLLERKMKSGATEEAALAHYESSDGPNVRLTLKERLPADMTLKMLGDGMLMIKEKYV